MSKLGENALWVFRRLYLDEGETKPLHTFKRVSNAVAKVRPDLEAYKEEFIRIQNENRFRVNTPCYMNLGCNRRQIASACFVGNLQDSMPEIKQFYDDATEVFLAGAGIGANFSDLREGGSGLSSGGSSSGPISFIRHLNSLGGTIKSGGKTRRAAAMVVFDVTHPDVMEVIRLKTLEDLSNINISINLTDDFLQCLQMDGIWETTGFKDGMIKTKIKARDVMNAIAESSHACGDPGVVFLDRINNWDTVPSLGKIRTTNPCGEQPLHAYQSCDLGSINIGVHVDTTGIRWEELEKTVRMSVRMLDGMLDAAEFPTENFKRVAQQTRNIGLGIMGLADTFLMLSLPYESTQARELAGQVMNFVTSIAWSESVALAKETTPFPLYQENKERIQTLWQIDEPVRNSQVTTIAPTGTVSISCECSSGMEPLFAIVYEKKITDTGDIMTFVHPEFEKRYYRETWYDSQLINEIKKRGGTLQKINKVPPEVKRLWKTAHDIHWQDRILMQAELQRAVTSSISSTVNLPNDATVEDVYQLIFFAHEQGLKGVTVYRDGSKTNQPIKFGGVVPEVRRFKRPRKLTGNTFCVKTAQGHMYITINCHEATPVECFVEIGKSGNNKKADAEALGRMVSLLFQMGCSVQQVYDQLEGIAGRDVTWDEGKKVLSIYDALARVLWEEYIDPQRETITAEYDECPNCRQGRYIHKEGCGECLDCGFSKCG
jgi:ribonucleoside-diphosphate reductase alpha chain